MDFSTLERITLPDGPLAYRSRPGDQPPLLLIHGWGGSSGYWIQTSEALADIRSLFAPDLPGHGATPPRGSDQGPESLARLIIAYADRLGIDRFDLNGHSWGAAIAILVAARWPDRVGRLVLTSLGVARSRLERAAITQTHKQMRALMLFWRPWFVMAQPWSALARPALALVVDQPLVYRTLARRVVRHLPDDETIRRGVADLVATDPLTALENAIDAGSPVFAKALERVVAPTLVIHGDRDALMPASGTQALAACLRDVRRVALSDCGHLPMIERPLPYHHALRTFLSEPIAVAEPHR
jgi:pimeloyl-ACP methyl ester carboxylesterase